MSRQSSTDRPEETLALRRHRVPSTGVPAVTHGPARTPARHGLRDSAAVALVVGLALVAGPARAADTTDGASLELYPTHHALGIAIEFEGDDDGDATASCEVRLDGGGWVPGPTLVRGDLPNTTLFAWRGSLFPLLGGTTIAVRATVTDPDNDSPVTLEDETAIRVYRVEPTGATYHVSMDGDDAASGLSEGEAWQSIGHAIATAGCGDTVLVGSGVYRERLSFDGKLCTADEPFVLRRAGTERPVIDNGIELAPASGGWSVHQGDIWVRELAVPEDKYIRVLTVDGQRTMRYVALSDLEQDGTNDLQLGRCYVQERVDATTRRLYLRTGLGDSPDEHTIVFSQSGTEEVRDWQDNVGVLFANASHVVLDGFEVRHSGGRAIAFSTGADDNLVTGCLLHANNVNVEMRHGSDNLIWDNEIHEVGTGSYPWRAFYDDRTESYEGYMLVMLKADRGISVVGNELHDGWDLIGAGFAFEENLRGDADIFYNRIYNSADDALELDGPGIQLRVYGNELRHVFCGVSLAPITVGPTYVARNTFTFDLILFKQNNCMGTDQDGDAFVWHNSAFPLRTCAGTGVTTAPWDCGAEPYEFANRHFVNNLMMTGSAAIRGRPGLELDYNGWGPPSDVSEPFDWSAAPGESTRYDIAGLRETAGQEHHGFTLAELGASDPGLVSTSGLRALDCPLPDYEDYRVYDYAVYAAPFGDEDFELVSSSVLIDRASPIAGFNEGYGAAAPDVGAHELGQPAPWEPGGSWSPEGGAAGSGGGISAAGGTSGGAGGAIAASGAATEDDGGCGCRLSGDGSKERHGLGLAWAAVVLSAARVRRRRSMRASSRAGKRIGGSTHAHEAAERPTEPAPKALG